MPKIETDEEKRLEEDRAQQKHWRRWGPYLSERQWGTVREDYSAHGNAWEYFPHEHARSRAYRWGEDGIAGISDNHQRLCFAIAMWNGQDRMLKERLFGVTGNEGNHGEDVKEQYFYLDNTPTHSYMKYLYKYPQAPFPYKELIAETQKRSRADAEFELLDTKLFDNNEYFDVFVEYAKGGPEDILIRISAYNRNGSTRILQLLPTLWFRNTWSWKKLTDKPSIKEISSGKKFDVAEAEDSTLGKRWLYCDKSLNLLFTENETNYQEIFGIGNPGPYTKDGINKYVIDGNKSAVSNLKQGTKMSAHYALDIEGGAGVVIRLRLTDREGLEEPLTEDFDQIFEKRVAEADAFYNRITPHPMTEDERLVQRQAFAGMLWNKQFYHYVVKEWLDGDPLGPSPPPERKHGRNRDWVHLYNDDIISMPDKWEYPWFAAWDLAFHVIPLAVIDPEFAKKQLMLLTREWYMHPNGQLPAYEWAFGDVNPPVHAWAAYRVYKIEEKVFGRKDPLFLERVFQKLLINFTWWINRKDPSGRNIFQGGFLGLDNIGVFDRSSELPTGGYIEQSDGTSWMGMYCLNMLTIAFELAETNPAYEDIASKFFEHFLYIAEAMQNLGGADCGLWDEADGFFYDVLHLPNGEQLPLKVRSMVGLIPLFATQTLEQRVVERLPGFGKRLRWFIDNRKDLASNVARMDKPGVGMRGLLAIVGPTKLKRILEKMLDENEFLSPFGIRSLSKYHKDHPYIFNVNGHDYRVDYDPAESTSGFFGGNSNWRGPVWIPVNFLIIESLQRYHYYFGDSFKVECPTGSGNMMTLWEVASELSERLCRLFYRGRDGARPVNSAAEQFKNDPHWKDLVLFFEYFHGDTGTGLGANHQTGWTGLVAKLIQQHAEYSCKK